MPLPLTVSCSSKIQIGFTCQVPAHLGSPGKGPLNWYVCVCVCVRVCVYRSLKNPMTARGMNATVMSREPSTAVPMWWIIIRLPARPTIDLMCLFFLDTRTHFHTSQILSLLQRIRDLPAAFSFSNTILGQLSLASLRGRLIEYQLRMG